MPDRHRVEQAELKANYPACIATSSSVQSAQWIHTQRGGTNHGDIHSTLLAHLYNSHLEMSVMATHTGLARQQSKHVICSNNVLCIIDGLTIFSKIAIQGTPQMAADKEAITLSRVYSYHSNCNLLLRDICLFCC